MGWEPTCKHYPDWPETLLVDPVPCTVLDPFSGSGTVLQVARWLGRKGLGIELSEEYCEQSIVRINQPQRKPRGGVKPLRGQTEMFE